MSLLKMIRAQLGLSTTPANNFTFDASADNGTMKLARGNAGATTQDIMTVDAAGNVAFPQMAQSWQDVKASRALNVTYTNTTGQTIFVSITAASTSAATLQFAINGVQIAQTTQNTAGTFISLCLPVQAGATYTAAVNLGTPTIDKWLELRN